MGDWICPRCKWVNRGFADRCLGCGDAKDPNAPPAPPVESREEPGANPVGGGWLAPPAGSMMTSAESTPAPGGPMMAPPGPMMAPAGPMVAPPGPLSASPAYAPAAPATPAGAADQTLGLLAGLIAAALSAGVWYAVVAFSNIQFGLLAAAIGWLVGTATVFGAGGRGSLVLAAGSTVFTLLALAISEYLIVYHFVTEDGGFALELIQPPDVMLDFVMTSLSFDPITLLFWGIALVAAAWIPFKAISQPSRFGL